MKTILEAATLAAEVQRLNDLLAEPDGNQRWEALQTWLNKNPGLAKLVDEWVRLEPDKVMGAIETHLAERFNVSPNLFGLLDPNHEIRNKVQFSIGRIQELYRLRKEMDGERGRLTG